jgi:GNAT superfamily N-acetyltransferase
MADVRTAPRYSIVPGDPVEHKREWLGLADRNLPFAVQGREARYSKYYEDNPLGPAKFFLARDAQSDAFVGMAAIFPTRLRVFGELVPAAIAGDFAVDDGHRGLGPAVPLQRAAVNALGDHGLSCAYGYPNEHSEPITRRVGYADLGRLTRFVKVLRSRVVVEQYVHSRGFARLAAGVSRVAVDPLLFVVSRERLHRRRRAFRVERPAAFDDRFSEVWETAWGQGTITSERNPEFLNWKYETAREGGIYRIFALIGSDDQVAGYAVYRVRNGIRHIIDIVFQPSGEVLDVLLAALIRDARREGAVAVSLIHLGPASLLTQRLRAFGFGRRTEDSSLHVYVPGTSELEQALVEAGNWYFLNADADV